MPGLRRPVDTDGYGNGSRGGQHFTGKNKLCEQEVVIEVTWTALTAESRGFRFCLEGCRRDGIYARLC